MIVDAFGYHNFFREKIAAKKKDHSYRIFKRVARLAEKPPFANELTEYSKAVTVWCSNDYLGMTSHPLVKKAIM